MDLNRSDWKKAQTLLVNLVEILTPFAQTGEDPKYFSPSFFNPRFFIPPQVKQEEEQTFRLRHPVSLLKAALHSTQQQVDQWIEQLPSKEDPKTEAPLSQRFVALTTQEGQGRGEELKKSSREAAKGPAKGNSPISWQAKKLIDQVRAAIATLCHSAHIVDPQPAPLKEALKRLKPLIDALMEVVSQEEPHSDNREENRQTRAPLPLSSRQQLIKKMVLFSQNRPPADLEKGNVKREEKEKRALEIHKEEANSEKKGEDFSSSKEKRRESQQGEIESLQQEVSSFPAEKKVTVSTIPFFLPQHRLPLGQRKKKKRKGFLFSKEKEDPTNS